MAAEHISSEQGFNRMDLSIFTKHEGSAAGEILFFGLSTCIWCRKTREYLIGKGVAFHFVYVDQLDDRTKHEVREWLRKWNPDISYPTIVFNNERSVVGFNEDDIDREIGK